jgi:hypothetical protein
MSINPNDNPNSSYVPQIPYSPPTNSNSTNVNTTKVSQPAINNSQSNFLANIGYMFAGSLITLISSQVPGIVKRIADCICPPKDKEHAKDS